MPRGVLPGRLPDRELAVKSTSHVRFEQGARRLLLLLLRCNDERASLRRDLTSSSDDDAGAAVVVAGLTGVVPFRVRGVCVVSDHGMHSKK